MTAQVVLSITYAIGYFRVLEKFLDGDVHTPTEWKDVLIALVGALTTGLALILAYWFQRQREQTPRQDVQ